MVALGDQPRARSIVSKLRTPFVPDFVIYFGPLNSRVLNWRKLLLRDNQSHALTHILHFDTLITMNTDITLAQTWAICPPLKKQLQRLVETRDSVKSSTKHGARRKDSAELFGTLHWCDRIRALSESVRLERKSRTFLALFQLIFEMFSNCLEWSDNPTAWDMRKWDVRRLTARQSSTSRQSVRQEGLVLLYRLSTPQQRKY